MLTIWLQVWSIFLKHVDQLFSQVWATKYAMPFSDLWVRNTQFQKDCGATFDRKCFGLQFPTDLSLFLCSTKYRGWFFHAICLRVLYFPSRWHAQFFFGCEDCWLVSNSQVPVNRGYMGVNFMSSNAMKFFQYWHIIFSIYIRL